MSKNRKVNYGRIFVLDLEAGEDVWQCVDAFCKENEIKTGVFLSGVGTLINCVSHYTYVMENGKYMDGPLTWENTPMMVSGVQGFVENGFTGKNSKVHLHAVIGNKEECSTIHFHEGCIVHESLSLVIAELLEEA